MLPLSKIHLLLRYCCYAVAAVGIFGILISSHLSFQQSQEKKQTLRRFRPIPPSITPSPTQQSINFAMDFYHISVPENTAYPKYDPNLTDRGITMRKGFSAEYEIYIGPSAFSSWGLLGSTLAHELEIHARQSFFAIYLLDKLGFAATESAERLAYNYELLLADYFNLSHEDRRLILETREFYYPEKPHKESKNKGYMSALSSLQTIIFATLVDEQ